MATPPALPITPPEPEPGPSFWKTVWGKLKAIGKWSARNLAAPGVALLIVAGAVLLVAIGVKNVQIGGILGKLFGKKKPETKAIDVANTVPEGRVDDKGKIIPVGEPDSKGMTQAVVVPIKDPGIFSNPDTIRFDDPTTAKPIEITLPDGVKSKDVEQVVVVRPDKFVVTVKDSSGVTAKQIDSLLAKYK